ncbi:MAG: T9SS type A sorting domain-containing protein [Bacteroidales bacterium]|nr:T9SS type A sorting domain-containing protein [Bacteroidales bacterium]
MLKSALIKLMLVVAIVIGGKMAWGQTDRLTNDLIGAGASYSDWSGISINSGAVYAGQSAGSYNSIQLRSKNSNSGIITTTSNSTVAKITVTWNSNTVSERTLDIYGKNTPYSAASDLYNVSTQGTLLGSIICGTSTELLISGNYTYIGLRSRSDAMYLDNIDIEWGVLSSYNVTWSVAGETVAPTNVYTNRLTDSNIPSNPELSACDNSRTFVGWTDSPIDGEQNGLPTPCYSRDDLNGMFVLDDITYYAVFADVLSTPETWELVTNVSSLSTGNKIVIAAKGYNYAISTTQNNNNRAQATITKNGSTITWNSNVCEFDLKEGTEEGTWAFYDAANSGYIYAASSSANQLKTQTTNNANGSWSISISANGTATIIAQGNNTRNNLRYNSSGSGQLFSCYASGQQDVAIYKKHGGNSYSACTTICPCNYGTIDGISGDDNFIWSGKNVGADWEATSNWVVYRTSDSKYHLAADAPASSNNVFIIKNDDCNIVTPTVSEDATCGNLTMLNGLDIDIAENQTLTINGTATFTNGVINGNVIFGSSATVSGASASSHIDGVVTKSGAANGFTFPTGSNGNLGKVVVTDGTATNVSVQYFSNPAGFGTNDLPRWWNAADMSGENPFNHVSNVEYWKISSNEAITADFVAEASTDMHFNSETAEEDRIPANIQMAFYDNNRWTNVGGSASIDGNTLSINGAEIPASATRGISGNYTTFGSKSKSTVLPIELVSFTANCNGRSALIEWTTATEKNNDFFVLERSHDAVNFKEIARIAGAGNSIEPISYAYTDFGVRNGDNYYRLVQFDYDGTSTASEIIVANCLGTDGEPGVLAYPNPFGDDLTLRFENFGNIQATVEVYDMLGRMVHTQKINCSQNDYEIVLRLAGLSDGTYNVRISAKNFVLNKKVVKQ